MSEAKEIGALAKALAKAQSEMRHAQKDRTNPHFKNEYATLASVIDACKEPLNANGIAIVQLVCGESADLATVETMLLHESGQSISARYSMPVAKKDPQGHGSAITYARRYALLAIVGLAADDDDGNDASRKPSPAAQQREQAPQDAPRITTGAGKGTLLSEASEVMLSDYRSMAADALNDRSKAHVHALAQKAIDDVDAERAARAAR